MEHKNIISPILKTSNDLSCSLFGCDLSWFAHLAHNLFAFVSSELNISKFYFGLLKVPRVLKIFEDAIDVIL